MKFAAFILLLAFSTYFTETIDMPVNKCTGSAEKISCKNMSGSTCPMCHKEALPRKPAKGCTNSSACVDCPLCYNLLPVKYNNITTVVTSIKQQYAEHTVDLIPGYISASWKPPNAV
jgi:hypothetical protein